MLTEKQHAQRKEAAAASLKKRQKAKAQRQAEVKRLDAVGMSKAEISRRLGVNYYTILRDFQDFRDAEQKRKGQ